MVSVICNNGLNRSVKEFGLENPGLILDKTRELVTNDLERSKDGYQMSDGMDISLCVLEGDKLAYAGAHNPLWLIRKGESTIQEIKGDKQPVGFHPNSKNFQTHTLQLDKGDTIYIFSDGFADQFGGEFGKKFKMKNFRSLLGEIQHLDMTQQREAIDSAFQAWRGNHEQLDDICIIGVRV